MEKKITKKRKRRKSSRSKPVVLSPEVWLRNAKDIKAYRTSELYEQEGKCAISGLPLQDGGGCLDHTHAAGIGVDGKVRGVLLSEVNTLEGKYLKQFKRLKLDEKFGLSFPQLLINMGEYLLQDNSKKPYHHKYMDDLRNYIKRLRNDQIREKLLKDFNIQVDTPTDKKELVRLYVQAFVDLVEKRDRR